MRLAESIQTAFILDDATASNRDRAFAAILDKMASDRLFPAQLIPELQSALISRDELGPTGIGEGVAIPHVWHTGLERMASSLAVSLRGLDYPSLDGEPVHLIVTILTPPDATCEAAKQRLFESWLHHLRDPAFRAELRLANTHEELWQAIRSADAGS